MTVKSCEKLEKSRVALTIEVGAEEFEAAVNKAYLKMRGKMNIPGFRPGKAPRKMIESMYGAEVFYEEAVNAVLPDAYESAVDEQKLEVVGYPQVEVESVGKNITFRFDVTGPKDANGTYSGVEFINGKAVVEITGEGSVTMQGLPTGKYTVTERTPEYVAGMNLAISYLDTDETNAADGIVTLAKDAAAKVTVTNEYTYEDDDGPEEPDGPKEIKDPEVPLTPVEPPVEPVDPEEPGTDIPEEPGTDIPEEETPKADAPETGDATIVWILAAAVSGIGLVWLAISGKKKKDENAE